MELISNYMRNDIQRHMLNVLTQKIFGFDFESWVAGGYFEGDYIPYSFVEDGKIVANVSVNKMCFTMNLRQIPHSSATEYWNMYLGQQPQGVLSQKEIRRDYIQIGTVMTDEAYRKQGLARRLIEHVLKEYEGKCDGFYLFGDIDALGFYQKMGFEEGLQYQYSLKGDWIGKAKEGTAFKKASGQLRMKYMDAVRNSAVNAALEQVNKYGLQMFYTADLCNVYYAADIDCFAIIEQWDDTLVLQSVISKEHVSMRDVIARIDVGYNSLRLGFSPCAEDGYMFEASAYDGGNDYRLFYRGEGLECIEKEMLFFPQLSHA